MLQCGTRSGSPRWCGDFTIDHYLGKIFSVIAPRMRTPSRRSGARSCHAPGGDGCMRSAGGRAAVCGAPAGRVPNFGAFSSSPYTAFVLGLGAQHRGIVKLSEGG